jgi:hypothetical protein
MKKNITILISGITFCAITLPIEQAPQQSFFALEMLAQVALQQAYTEPIDLSAPGQANKKIRIHREIDARPSKQPHSARKQHCPKSGCSYCGVNLPRHTKNVHPGEKLFPCKHPHCGNAFAQLQELIRHHKEAHTSGAKA